MTNQSNASLSARSNKAQPEEAAVISIKTANNAFLTEAANKQAEQAGKLTLRQDIKQRFARIADEMKAGQLTVMEAETEAGFAAIDLYKAAKDGSFSKDDITSILGETYGFAVKDDGKVSKTPAKAGETIRKRVERCRSAAIYVREREAGQAFTDVGRFFDKMPVERVKDILSLLDPVATDEEPNPKPLSIFTVYEHLSDLAKEVKDAPIAFEVNADKIMDFQDKLSSAATMATIMASPALKAAYGGLLQTLIILGEAIGSHESEAKAA